MNWNKNYTQFYVKTPHHGIVDINLRDDGTGEGLGLETDVVFEDYLNSGPQQGYCPKIAIKWLKAEGFLEHAMSTCRNMHLDI